METQKTTKMDRELIIQFEDNAPERQLCKCCDHGELSHMVEVRIQKYYNTLTDEELEECTLNEDDLHRECYDVAGLCVNCYNDLQADLGE